MAIIEYTQVFPIEGNHSFMLITWPNMANGDTGNPFILAQYADRSIQVEGTFGAAGTLLLEGTNNNTAWRTLRDPFSNSISITTPNIEAVSELVLGIRPRVSSGDATTSLTVSALVRKNN